MVNVILKLVRKKSFRSTLGVFMRNRWKLAIYAKFKSNMSIIMLKFIRMILIMLGKSTERYHDRIPSHTYPYSIVVPMTKFPYRALQTLEFDVDQDVK